MALDMFCFVNIQNWDIWTIENNFYCGLQSRAKIDYVKIMDEFVEQIPQLIEEAKANNEKEINKEALVSKFLSMKDITEILDVEYKVVEEKGDYSWGTLEYKGYTFEVTLSGFIGRIDIDYNLILED